MTKLSEIAAKAVALLQAGDPERAAALLEAAAADPEISSLEPQTALGLPRKLHSAFLKLSKARHDPIARIGYQYNLVPPPALLQAFARPNLAERRAIAKASREPVPPVIHQIWIGPQAPPPAAAAWARHAHAHGYGYRLWREADLAALGLEGDETYAQMLARGDYPGAVDVARYLLLEQEGGIYLDCDWYPARDDISFHDLLPMTGLAVFAEEVPRNLGGSSLLLANSFIAAPPHHPALAAMVATLPKVAQILSPRAPAWWSTGPLIFSLVCRRGPLTLADAGFIAASLPRGAAMGEVDKARQNALAADGGLLIAWKSW